MPQPVSLTAAKAFLRVTDEAQNDVIDLLLEAAQARIEAACDLILDEASPAPLRLAVLLLTAHAFEHREQAELPLGLVEPWLAPYRAVRL